MTDAFELLFDAELHDSGSSEIVYRTDTEGEPIGSGSGLVR